jgi:hypothetical protein
MNSHLLLAIFHLVFVAPFFLYVGFQRAATPDWAYNLLFGLGLFMLAYHGMKSIVRYYAQSPAIWINLIHTFIIAPLLIWIGYQGKKTGRPAYEMLLMTAFAALGYHLKSLIEIVNTFGIKGAAHGDDD